jgi:hypothetical protein
MPWENFAHGFPEKIFFESSTKPKSNMAGHWMRWSVIGEHVMLKGYQRYLILAPFVS